MSSPSCHGPSVCNGFQHKSQPSLLANFRPYFQKKFGYGCSKGSIFEENVHSLTSFGNKLFAFCTLGELSQIFHYPPSARGVLMYPVNSHASFSSGLFRASILAFMTPSSFLLHIDSRGVTMTFSLSYHAISTKFTLARSLNHASAWGFR
jgi:hypothetical protein